MADVAAEAGVSIKTVSRVINKVPSVHPELVQRVTAAVAKLGFRRNDMASKLRSGVSSATIGLIIGQLGNPFYSTIASAAAEVALGHDTLLITASSEQRPEQERRLLQELCERRVDGLLLVTVGADPALLREEMAMGMPVVLLDRPVPGLSVDSVLLDNAGGMAAGVERLLADGHERIALLLDSLALLPMRERLIGAQAALAGAGLSAEDMIVVDGVSDPRSAAEVTRRLLERPDPPTAFACGTNRITTGVVSELWRSGRRAGVVGFDDFELSPLVPMPITVIRYDVREMGRRGAEMLFRRIAGDTSAPVTTVLPTELVDRGNAYPA